MSRAQTRNFKRYSQRNANHMILSEPEVTPISPYLTGIEPLPGPRDHNPIDFTDCPLADPDRIWIASRIVRRRPLHERYKSGTEVG